MCCSDAPRVIAARDARNVEERHPAVDAQREQLLVVVVERRAQRPHAVAGLALAPLRGGPPQLVLELLHDAALRERHVALRASGWNSQRAHRGVTEHDVGPRAKRRRKTKRRQRPTEVFAPRGERLGGDVGVARARGEKADDLATVVLQRAAGERLEISGGVQAAELLFDSDVARGARARGRHHATLPARPRCAARERRPPRDGRRRRSSTGDVVEHGTLHTRAHAYSGNHLH
jgi:hypothetical protein